MSIVLIGLFIIFGIIAAILILVILIFIKFRMMAKSYGFNDLKSLYSEIKQGTYDSFTKEKSIGAQTNLLLPKILKDFKNFSVDEMYSKTETSIRSIFNSLENRTISDTKELVLISENLKEEIEDMFSNDIKVKYDNIKFHKHGIKYYSNSDGVLNITINTSLEYNFEKTKNGKIISKNNNYKKQDRIVSKFIYVYNPDKYTKSESLIGITCPNCGAAVKELGNKKCRYCNSGLEDINLKSWHIISYKSDF